jgi:lipoyl(octanoyl) transferase
MLEIIDLATLAYRPAWERQLEVHERVLAGDLPDGALILVEHPPVITLGRRQSAMQNLLATSTMLQSRGVELVESDRGGDITFHGPGQLVTYPILPLNRYHLNLHAYMRFLEEAVIQTLGGFGVAGERLEGATGVWVNVLAPRGDARAGAGDETAEVSPAKSLAKICAMGVKLRKWVTLHGLALNVTTDLGFFGLINPCGLGRPVTSLEKILGRECPAMAEVKKALAGRFSRLLAEMPALGVGS